MYNTAVVVAPLNAHDMELCITAPLLVYAPGDGAFFIPVRWSLTTGVIFSCASDKGYEWQRGKCPFHLPRCLFNLQEEELSPIFFLEKSFRVRALL